MPNYFKIRQGNQWLRPVNATCDFRISHSTANSAHCTSTAALPWCNSHHTLEFVCLLEEGQMKNIADCLRWKGGLHVSSGKGTRLIVCAVGSEDGFLENSTLCFVGNAKSDYYHKEMNSRHFQDWWFEKVLPNVRDKSVIVIDNAPSHPRNRPKSQNSQTPVGEKHPYKIG